MPAATFALQLQLRNNPTTVTVKPSAVVGYDGVVFEDLPNFTDGAISEDLFCQATAAHRIFGLVKFDLSTLPTMGDISGATLSIWTKAGTAAVHNITVSRILPANSGWLESATWNFADGAVGADRWAGDAASNGGTDAGCSVAGTDYSSTPMGTVAIPNPTSARTRFDITLNLTQFELMRSANHGLHFQTDASAAISFATSDEATNAADRVQISGTSLWTDVTTDLRLEPSLRASYGIQGAKPTDRVASTGTMNLALDNSQKNSAHLIGYYAPGHANCRTGFELGIPARIAITYSGTTYYKFRGSLEEIGPAPGKNGTRLTYCTVVDWMDEAAKQKIRLLATQVNQRGGQVIATVIGGMTRKPAASSLALGVDTFPFAIDNDHDSQDSPMRIFQNVANSELGFLYIMGDTTQGGTLIFQDRHQRPSAGSALSAFNDTMVAMTPRRSRADIFNHVRNVIHPRRVDAGAVSLYTLRQPQPIPDSDVLTIQGNYVDPAGGSALRVGAFTTCNLTPTTDFLVNTASDGSGTNITTAACLSGSFGANSFQITASMAPGFISFTGLPTWVTQLRVRGRGMYDYDPLTLESIDPISSACYGENVLPFDMPYQTSASVGRDAADYLLQVWSAPLTRVENVAFVGNSSNALMLAGLGLDISDRITLAETATGINGDYYIQAVDFQISAPNIFSFAWLVAPVDPYDSWILGVPGFSELGVTTRLGY